MDLVILVEDLNGFQEGHLARIGRKGLVNASDSHLLASPNFVSDVDAGSWVLPDENGRQARYGKAALDPVGNPGSEFSSDALGEGFSVQDGRFFAGRFHAVVYA